MIADATHIRELARKVAEIAASDQTRAKREMWARHNALEKVERPPVMCRPSGAWRELVPAESILTTDPLFRDIETQLRMRLYKDSLADDEVVEPWVSVPASHLGEDRAMMWGVNIDVVHGGGSFIFKPEIRTEEDIEKLKVPDWRVDHAATGERFEKASALLDGILDVHVEYGRLSGAGLAYWGAYLRGLEQMMWDCMDRPEWLARFMKLIADAHFAHLKGLEADNHITRNDVGVINSVCMACRNLPKPGFDPARVRLVDTWGGGDSQEFTSVSPAQWEELLLNYQLPLFELYGLVCYGCCESMVGKLEILMRKVPNLRRITVSPWSDIAYSAAQCGRRVVMQIRPMPTDVLMRFTEEEMREDLVRKMEQAGDTIYDFCLQDIETVSGHPETMASWVRAAKQVGAERYHLG